jgi:hypothetical protein
VHDHTRPGRFGQDRQLVPGQPRSIRVCAGTTGISDTSYRSATRSAGFRPLLDALNKLARTPTTSSCQGDGDQSTFYELLATYDRGPSVLIRIDPHCAPAIDNETLQAADAHDVVPPLEEVLAR